MDYGIAEKKQRISLYWLLGLVLFGALLTIGLTIWTSWFFFVLIPAGVATILLLVLKVTDNGLFAFLASLAFFLYCSVILYVFLCIYGWQFDKAMGNLFSEGYAGTSLPFLWIYWLATSVVGLVHCVRFV